MDILILEDSINLTKFDREKIKDFSIFYSPISLIEKNLNKNNISLIVANSLPLHIQQLLKERNIKTISPKEFMEKYLEKIDIEPEYLNKLSLSPYNKFQYLFKRFIDFAISIPLLVLSSPLIAYSIYRIKKESPDGPVLFTQNRVGENGKIFKCYKFRSMRTDSEYFSEYTQENDPRIFPWGEFMRKSRIDELPQILNVIKGDMHLIGPRAEWEKLVKNYEKEIPFYHKRHLVKPGITGWAQVNYPYGSNLEDTKQKLMYDLFYIKNWSIKLELKTIFKTIEVMLKKKGR